MSRAFDQSLHTVYTTHLLGIPVLRATVAILEYLCVGLGIVKVSGSIVCLGAHPHRHEGPSVRFRLEHVMGGSLVWTSAYLLGRF